MLPRVNRYYSLLMLGISGIVLSALVVSSVLLVTKILPIIPGAIVVFLLFSWCSYGYPLQKKLVSAYLSKRGMTMHDLS